MSKNSRKPGEPTHEPIQRFVSTSTSATRQFAASIAKKIFESGKQTLISLEGPLGAGKTVFAKGFIVAWMAEGFEKIPEDEVVSPTFNLCKTYQPSNERPGMRLDHYDLYRIEQNSELDEIGFENSLGDCRCVLVEWFSKINGISRYSNEVVYEIRLTIDAANPESRLIEVENLKRSL